jgi:hypothetical protein
MKLLKRIKQFIKKIDKKVEKACKKIDTETWRDFISRQNRSLF